MLTARKEEIRSEIQLLQESVTLWQNKYSFLLQQMKQLNIKQKKQKNDLKINKHAKPHIIRKDVAL